MTISIRLPASDGALLERAADILHISKSEFIRRSIAAYTERVIPAQQAAAEIDALYIGQGGGLRLPETVKNLQKRSVLEHLREKHGYAD